MPHRLIGCRFSICAIIRPMNAGIGCRMTQVGTQVLRKTGCRTFVAWLAVVALWLTIVMPVVSRVLPASSNSASLGLWCTGHGLDNAPHPGAPTDPVSSMDKCGYCGLLGHSPLCLGAATALLPPSMLPAPTPVFVAITTPPHVRRLGARPRGPPAHA
jgi:hypothetical protein